MANKPLVEGVHYYFNEEGKMVLTALYLSERGYCCGNGCLHCPYDYQNVPAAKREWLLHQRKTKRHDEEG